MFKIGFKNAKYSADRWNYVYILCHALDIFFNEGRFLTVRFFQLIDGELKIHSLKLRLSCIYYGI